MIGPSHHWRRFNFLKSTRYTNTGLYSRFVAFCSSSSISSNPTTMASSVQSKEMSPAMENRIKGAIYGMYIGDALSMPVHWYYDLGQLRKDFGQITKYEAPKSRFSGSIMNLSNTGGAGRGSDKDSIIGDIILHGKRDFWLRGGQYHYHHGMKPGENTLDTTLCRLLMNTITNNGGVSSDNSGTTTLVNKYLTEYARFMTTPDSHNDVYAASAHRMFFANYVKIGRQVGVDKLEQSADGHMLLRQCADNDNHNVDSVDGLINVIPISLLASVSPSLSQEVQSQRISEVTNALRKSQKLPQYGNLMDELLRLLIQGDDLRESIVKIALKVPQGGAPLVEQLKKTVNEKPGNDPMSACYVSSNFPVTLYFAYKYADDPKQALLASTNAGGENVNRSALLGAIMGAAHGFDKLDKSLVKGLVEVNEYEKEINQFLEILKPKIQKSEL